MRRKEKEIIDVAEIEDIIKNSLVCRLAMVDGDKPYIVPLSFGYQFPYLYFHSACRGQKIDLIKKNCNVCFEFDQVGKLVKNKDACEWGVEYKSVIGSGKAFFVNDSEKKKQGMTRIMAQYSGRSFEFPRKNLEKTMVICVTIESMTGKTSR